MKHIYNLSKFKELSLYFVMDKDNKPLGILRVYYPQNTSNPDKSVQIEVQEFIDNDPHKRSDIRSFIGYSELETVKGEILFGVLINKESYLNISEFLQIEKGYKVINLL